MAGDVGEGAVAVVVEEVHLVERAGGADHDVEAAVAVEVFDEDAAGVAGDVDAGGGGDFGEFGEVVFGLEAGLRG